MSEVRDPQTDQPLPSEGQLPVHQAVIDSLPVWLPRYGDDILRAIEQGLLARRELGIRKYGRELETHNGRDSLQDLWEEALDATAYAAQAELEGYEAGDVVLALTKILARLAGMKLERGDVEVR